MKKWLAIASLVSAMSASLPAQDTVVTVARTQLGAKYRWGAKKPGTMFDCSGLTQFVLGSLGLRVPRTAHEQSQIGVAVPRDTSRMRPGDLITFGSRRRITHIGIYAGDGKFIHASSRFGKVVESPLTGWYAKRWMGVRRVEGVG